MNDAIAVLDTILHAIANASGFTGERDGDAEMLVEHVRKQAEELRQLRALVAELKARPTYAQGFDDHVAQCHAFGLFDDLEPVTCLFGAEVSGND